jgi:hypothetical protein
MVAAPGAPTAGALGAAVGSCSPVHADQSVTTRGRLSRAGQLVRRQLTPRLARRQVAGLEQVPAEGRGEGLAGGVEAARVG